MYYITCVYVGGIEAEVATSFPQAGIISQSIMSSWEQDIIFYTNGRGGVAVSVDRGDSLILANGRNIQAAETVWEETDEDVEARLTDVQKQAVTEVRSRPELDGMDKIVYGYTRARQNIQRNDMPLPGRKPPVLSEDAVVVVSDLED